MAAGEPLQVPIEIQDLIDNPQEALHIELKQWVDLSTDNVARAKIARHLAALANNGGGYLLFGFKDDGTPETPQSIDPKYYSRDLISGIIDKYLSPPFQIEVFFVPRSPGGDVYPIVRVPSHGKVPICSKRNGPHDDKGKPQGIREGLYYIREPGPKSIEIRTAAQWHDVIHRCVINERDSLLKALGKLLGQPEPVRSSSDDQLTDWHDQMRKQYSERAKND